MIDDVDVEATLDIKLSRAESDRTPCNKQRTKTNKQNETKFM